MNKKCRKFRPRRSINSVARHVLRRVANRRAIDDAVEEACGVRVNETWRRRMQKPRNVVCTVFYSGKKYLYCTRHPVFPPIFLIAKFVANKTGNPVSRDQVKYIGRARWIVG
jgi:hypothetical protein